MLSQSDLPVSASRIKHRITIAGDGIVHNHGQENKLQILETGDGEILISIAAYETAQGQYVTGGVVRFKSGGKRHTLLILIRELIFQALELKKGVPKSGVEGW